MSRLSLPLHFAKSWLRDSITPKFDNRAALKAWQYQQIRKHVRKIAKLSSYFEHQLEIHRSWKNFPIMDKQTFMDNFDTINTVGVHKDEAWEIANKAEQTRDFAPTIGDITIGLSSGTSGNRGIFMVSEKERADWAAYILRHFLPPFKWKKHKVAFFLRANSNLYQSTQSPILSFNFFDLKHTWEKNLNALHKLQPTILVAQPSALLLIAKAQESGKINIQPQKVVSVAEVLEDADKYYIENHLAQTVHQLYQCTEGFLAKTCKYGVLHFNEDIVHIEKEYIDKEKKRYHPIITDFRRSTQPIIRYRLNDIIIDKPEKCHCGSVFTPIEKIEGRADDIFYFKTQSGKKEIVFPDFIRRTIISTDTSIREYMVVQMDYENIHIYLQTDNFEATKKALTKSFKELFFLYHSIDIKLTFFKQLPLLDTQKLRRVRRSKQFKY